MCITDCHDMALAVKEALNPNTTKKKKEFNLIPGIHKPSMAKVKG